MTVSKTIATLGCLAILGCDRAPTPPNATTQATQATQATRATQKAAPAPALVTATPIPFALSLAFEAPTDAPVSVYVDPPRRGRERPVRVTLASDATAGTTALDLSTLPAGDQIVYVHAEGFADQWRRVKIEGGVAAPASEAITLYRQRWVTIRYALNRSGPDLAPDVAPPHRATLTHWGKLPLFGEDWQVWQGSNEPRGMFGPDPRLEFHRVATGYGFAKPTDGQAFEDIDAAPTDPAAYAIRDAPVTPGLTLICRVLGNNPVNGQSGYGKIVVESVSTTRPAAEATR